MNAAMRGGEIMSCFRLDSVPRCFGFAGHSGNPRTHLSDRYTQSERYTNVILSDPDSPKSLLPVSCEMPQSPFRILDALPKELPPQKAPH